MGETRQPERRTRPLDATVQPDAWRSAAADSVAAPTGAGPRAEHAASGATSAAARHDGYAPAWKVWLPVPILLILFGLAFDAFFWRIPKLSGPYEDWGYQFLIDMQRLHSPKPPGATRVVAFGSSVAMSFDPWQIEALLDAGRDSGAAFEVSRLLLPSVHPSSYRPFWDAEADDLHLDVAVAMVNPLDFLASDEEGQVNPTLSAALPPWQTLREQWSTMSVAEKIDRTLSGASNLYRYRKALRSSLHDHLRNLPRLIRRPAAKGYGVFADGYTRTRFGLVRDPAAPRRFEYFVHPEWIRQRGRVAVTFSVDGAVVAQRLEDAPGWKSIDLPASGASRAEFLEVAADGPWVPRAAGLGDDVRLLGVQLRTPPPVVASDAQAAPWRYPPYPPGWIREFLRQGGARGDQFAARWDEMMSRDDAFGTRFRAYRDEKRRVRDLPFARTREFEELERLVAGLSTHGVRVVVVNTPESEWLRREYEDGPYYRGYLAFFEELARKYPGTRFEDLRAALPAEDFNDWHHPNYVGVAKMGPKLAAAVQAVLSSPPSPRPGS